MHPTRQRRPPASACNGVRAHAGSPGRADVRPRVLWQCSPTALAAPPPSGRVPSMPPAASERFSRGRARQGTHERALGARILCARGAGGVARPHPCIAPCGVSAAVNKRGSACAASHAHAPPLAAAQRRGGVTRAKRTLERFALSARRAGGTRSRAAGLEDRPDGQQQPLPTASE